MHIEHKLLPFRDSNRALLVSPLVLRAPPPFLPFALLKPLVKSEQRIKTRPHLYYRRLARARVRVSHVRVDRREREQELTKELGRKYVDALRSKFGCNKTEQ